MRVLMLSKALVVGAYQRKAEELAQRPGMDLTVAVPPYWREGRQRLALERTYTAGYRLVTLPMVFNGRYHVHFYRHLRTLIDRVRPDLLHIDEEQYNLATFQALRLATQRRLPALFFTWQNIDRRYPPPFSLMERYNFAHAAHAIAGNTDAAAVIRAKGYSGPLTVIPQFGVDPALFAPGKRRSTGDHFVVGLVVGAGRPLAVKGFYVLLEALAGLSGDWVLHVIGSGEGQGEAEAQVIQRGLGERVRFLGRQGSTAMPEVLRDCDVLVGPSLTTPSWKEQFGRMLIEAMACEIPVIGSTSGEIPQVVGDAGVLVPEGDSGALREAIARLRARPEERHALGVRGRARVLDLFTMAAVARRTEEVYQAMLETHLTGR